MRKREQETKANFVRLPNGKVVRKVSKKKYLLCEQIRNYVLRTNYERGESIEIASLKAQCLFNVSEDVVWQSINKWKNWYYDDCKRHRPIELFIEDHKKDIEEQNSVKIEVIK